MRCARLAVLVLLTMGFAARPATAAEGGAAVRVRILDYARIPARAIAHAQRMVSELYGRAGVRTRWAETLRPADRAKRPLQAIDAQELFVIILSPAMSRRLEAREGVIGMAAITANDGGRVAYILFDRVWSIAHGAGMETMDVMGLTIAHELGHLLLPAGSHSPEGLMRAAWSLSDLRAADRRGFEVTGTQAELIRGRLAMRSHPPLD